MFDFNYFTPTKVVFGRGAEDQVAGLIKEFGGTKILIHYGGGSAIDSAKAIGYGVANEGDVWDFYDYKRKAQGCLPVGVILTLAATGSEMSDSSVITKEDGLVKRGYSSDFSRPRFAIMDPELTMTLPDYQTACGCTDIMMHTMERYFTNGGNMEITDALAEGLLRTVKKNALILHDDPKNYDARAEIMWAGSLAHNGLTGCGNDGGDWMTHKLEHELGVTATDEDLVLMAKKCAIGVGGEMGSAKVLDEAAMLSGFQSILSFNRVFREEKGMPPPENTVLCS